MSGDAKVLFASHIYDKSVVSIGIEAVPLRSKNLAAGGGKAKPINQSTHNR